MSLVTSVQRDVAEYEEKIFFGLTMRKLVCLAAIVVVVGIEIAIAYLVFNVDFGNVIVEIVAMVTAGAIFAIGYTKPLGMKFEEAVPIIIRHRFRNQVIPYKSHAALCSEEAEEEAQKNVKGGKRNARKAEDGFRKEYRRITKYRGVRSPEYLIPRYYEAGAYPKAVEAGAESGDEGAGS